LPTKGAKLLPRAKNLSKLFTVIGEKFNFFCSGPGNYLAFFVGTWAKVKILSEIKPPLGRFGFFLECLKISTVISFFDRSFFSHLTNFAALVS
jgi:hypothetical protein